MALKGMLIPAAACAVATISMASSVLAATIESAERLEWSGETYTVVVVRPENPAVPAFGERALSKETASHLLRMARNWTHLQYALQYPMIDRAFFEKMDRLDPVDDGRSLNIIVYRDQNPRDIQATLRIVWRKPGRQLLPSEELFGLRFDSQSGGLREFKELAVAGSAKVDWVAFLAHFVEARGLAFWHPLSANHYPPVAIGFYMVPLNWYSHTAYFVSTGYVLTCHEKLVPYYERLGFRRSSSTPISDQTHAMIISPADFRRLTMRRLRGRNHKPWPDVLSHDFATDCEALILSKKL